jgi:L-cysteine:1D-myo-inositol 2-amino-2-deoxy-alpha-D-glucopyranoside ligase
VKSWRRPDIPELPGRGPVPQLFDTASRSLKAAEASGIAGLYVCGITPYDATHLGHAATYLAFDTLIRLWLDAGYSVNYVQNITDIDDPLLERASATGADWGDLAADQIELFRSDMQSLGIIPPESYVAVTEMIEPIADAVAVLLQSGIAYRVDSPDAAPDIYFSNGAAAATSPWHLGQESNLDRPAMLAIFAERGGDPDRIGKHDQLDPLLWRAERVGEPSWPSAVGPGRPGWHIECSVIALANLDTPFTVNGGGSDLIFPHHEMSAGHAAVLSGKPLAEIYSHAGMVAYEGQKMSKSLGNLVLVSRLVADGVDPRAIRLAILAEHYRSDWEWTDSVLDSAQVRLAQWIDWAARTENSEGGDSAEELELLTKLRNILGNDLDTPRAIALVDAAVAGSTSPSAIDIAGIHALLGIDLAA